MTGLYRFIRENRAEIDAAIKRINPGQVYFNDEERRQWINSDEGLYRWARSEGVKI